MRICRAVQDASPCKSLRNNCIQFLERRRPARYGLTRLTPQPSGNVTAAI